MTTLDKLPIEIQNRIFSFVYPNWYLVAEQVQCLNPHMVLTFASSSKLQSSPLFTCRTVSSVASQAIRDSFTGALDARLPTRLLFGNKSQQCSIVPKYKKFIPRIFKLRIRDWRFCSPLTNLCLEKLPALKSIELEWPFSHCITNRDKERPWESVIFTSAEDAMFRIANQAQDDNSYASGLKHIQKKIQFVCLQRFQFPEEFRGYLLKRVQTEPLTGKQELIDEVCSLDLLQPRNWRLESRMQGYADDHDPDVHLPREWVDWHPQT